MIYATCPAKTLPTPPEPEGSLTQEPIGPIRPAQGGALDESPPRAEAPSPRLYPDAGNRRVLRMVINRPPRPEFRGQPRDAVSNKFAPKGVILERPPSPADEVGLVVKDPSPAPGPGFPLADDFLREDRNSSVGSARFRHARRLLHGRQGISARRTNWPSDHFDTQML